MVSLESSLRGGNDICVFIFNLVSVCYLIGCIQYSGLNKVTNGQKRPGKQKGDETVQAQTGLNKEETEKQAMLTKRQTSKIHSNFIWHSTLELNKQKENTEKLLSLDKLKQNDREIKLLSIKGVIMHIFPLQISTLELIKQGLGTKQAFTAFNR